MGIQLTLHNTRNWDAAKDRCEVGEQLAQSVIDTGQALGLIAQMFSPASLANVGMTVQRLSEYEAAIAYCYDISMLDFEGGQDYGFLYVFRNEPGGNPQISLVTQMVLALGNMYRWTCLSSVASFIADTTAELASHEMTAMRNALGYYRDADSWEGDRLVSPWKQSELGAQPWTPAANALSGQSVKPIQEARRKASSISRRQSDKSGEAYQM